MAKKPQTASTKPKTSFALSLQLRKQLKVRAAEEGRDMGAIVTDALEAYLAKSRSSRQN